MHFLDGYDLTGLDVLGLEERVPFGLYHLVEHTVFVHPFIIIKLNTKLTLYTA